MSRVLARTALVGVLALGLSGCGFADRVVGTRPIPVEVTGGAPLDVPTATAIAARVLGAAAGASTANDAAGSKERASVLAGAALATADAAAALGEPSSDAGSLILKADAPQVLAMSVGVQWPRWILATTLDEAAQTRSLHVLTSPAVDKPFVLDASVPMAGGEAVPALGDVAQGVAVVGGKPAPSGPDPAKVVDAYAKAIAFPKPVASDLVTTKDGLATDLKANTDRQAKALGKLASLTQTHAPAAGEAGKPVGFALAGGGALVFAQLVRTDRITLNAGAKELVLPADIAKLVKKAKVTTSVVVRSLENIVLVIPADGAARVIGAEEQRLDASGS